MDAFRKLREQVTKQQAVRKQCYGSSENQIPEAELHQYQKLEKLYASTRSAKHFQRDIVRAIEGYLISGARRSEVGQKLSEESMKYGVDKTCTKDDTLSNAALSYAKFCALIVNEHGSLLKFLDHQVIEPLREMVLGAPLEDARSLAKRYDRMRQEAEGQAVEVYKRQQRAREAPGNVENNSKLEAAETKLQELKSNMVVLGMEAVVAMSACEAQQQIFTSQLIIAMIQAERTYHKRIAQILEQLEAELASVRQRNEALNSPVIENHIRPPPAYEEIDNMFKFQTVGNVDESTVSMEYFLAEVMHSFQAETDAEINLSVGDFIIVRKVSSDGWAEGECKGKAGWFPFGYIKKRERVPASKVAVEHAVEL